MCYRYWTDTYASGGSDQVESSSSLTASSSVTSQVSPEVQNLVDMMACSVEVATSALAEAKGSVEDAVNLLLARAQ